jgi:hypothetical protein
VYYYSAPHGQTPINSIFFGVQQASVTPVDSLFVVRTQYVDQFRSTSPVINNKILTITALGKGLVEFMFLGADSTVGTPSEQLIYSVYWTTVSDVNAVLYTQCGVEYSHFETKHDWRNFTGITAGQTVSATLEDLEDEPYQFNVFVYDPSPLSTSGPSAFTVQQARPNGSGGGGGSISTKVLLGVGIPVAFFVLLLVLYLWWKNRRLSKELAVEMHESVYSCNEFNWNRGVKGLLGASSLFCSFAQPLFSMLLVYACVCVV